MTSHINSNSINGGFPVAGQANDSQGFRSNFTNIKNNFAFTKEEIEDLQNKVVLKAPLSGETSVHNDLKGVALSGATTHGFTESVYTYAEPATGQIDVSLGDYQQLNTFNGPITLAFDKWPAPGVLSRIRVQVDVVNVGDTITFPSSVTMGLMQVPGVNVTTRKITPPAPGTGTYVFELSTIDGGTNVTIFPLVYPGSIFSNLTLAEDLANGANAGIQEASYFTTAGSETATLAAGAPGQYKAFIANDVTAGNMVITVAEAGWKASGTGTITFNARGQGCSLQFINSKWFCIGNNGAVFA
jgi:hypothetical protein